MARTLLWLFAGVQIVCAAVFLWDLANTVLGLRATPISWQVREMLEIAASIGLLLGAGFGIWLVLNAGRRAQRAEDALRAASGAFATIVEEKFAEWALTPAEKEVAWLSLKGFSVTEIAGLRGTSESTVKVQSTAIYRKADVGGRAQLLAIFVEDLLDDQGIPGHAGAPDPEPIIETPIREAGASK